MHVLGLIREIKKYPFLFDRKSPENKILSSRDHAWKKIAATLGESPKRCKLRWKTLKDKFVKDSKECEENEPSQWKHHNDMSFLYDYLDLKRRPSFRPKNHMQETFLDDSIVNMAPTDTNYGEIEDTLDPFLDETMESMSSKGITNIKRNGIEESLLDEANEITAQKKKKIASFDFVSYNNSSKDPKKKTHDEHREEFYDLLGRLTNIAERLLLNSEEKGDGFLTFLLSILKKVDTRSQDRIKIEILNYANQRVEEILANQESFEQI